MPEQRILFTLVAQLRNINADFIFIVLCHLQSSISFDPSGIVREGGPSLLSHFLEGAEDR